MFNLVYRDVDKSAVSCIDCSPDDVASSRSSPLRNKQNSFYSTTSTSIQTVLLPLGIYQF